MTMYHRTPSPIFDAPEFPTLRRILPLPKRRRTTASPNSRDENAAPVSFAHSPSPTHGGKQQPGGPMTFRHQNYDNFPSPPLPPPTSTMPLFPPLPPPQPSTLTSFPTLPPLPPLPPSLDALGPNPTAEELNAHADSISTRMALQNYYLPLLGNVQNFLDNHAAVNGNLKAGGKENDTSTNGGSNSNAAAAAAAALAAVTGTGRNGSSIPLPPLSELNSLEFGVHFAAAAAAAAAAGIPMSGFANLGAGMTGLDLGMGGMASGVSEDESADPTSFPSFDDGRIVAVPSFSLEENNSYARGGNLSGGDAVYCDRDSDHIRQPGNTKKRKVPANADLSPRGGSGAAGDGGRAGSPSSFLDDDGGDVNSGSAVGFIAAGTGLADALGVAQKDRDRDKDPDSMSSTAVYPPTPYPGQLSLLVQKKGKLTAATLAGLQHKEMLKARKRQLAAVMGALSHGDTLALDQALSASYPLLGGMGGSRAGGSFVSGGDLLGPYGEELKVRKSKRKTVRLARSIRMLLETPERKNPHPDAVPFPASGFEFTCSSATADRLIATKEEVATLRKRFEAELARQAAKAAKLAVAAASGKALAKSSGRAKREKQEREREKAAAARMEKQKNLKAITNGDLTPESAISRTTSTSGNQLSDALGVSGSGGGKVKTGKKKKRSALANASNPHHLRNYVPSRLPNSGGQSEVAHDPQSGLNNFWPLPVRFLSAELPPRPSKGNHKKAPAANTPLVQLTRPAEEWICAFCEYDLFYGDDAAYRKATRSRKKILKRRQRAAERAAAAASGKSANKGSAPATGHTHDVEEDGGDDDNYLAADAFGASPTHRDAKWKEAPDKDPVRAVG